MHYKMHTNILFIFLLPIDVWSKDFSMFLALSLSKILLSPLSTLKKKLTILFCIWNKILFYIATSRIYPSVSRYEAEKSWPSVKCTITSSHKSHTWLGWLWNALCSNPLPYLLKVNNIKIEKHLLAYYWLWINTFYVLSNLSSESMFFKMLMFQRK